jgi:hypothetical protein
LVRAVDDLHRPEGRWLILWVVVAAAAAAALVPLVILALRLAAEVGALRDELARLGELRLDVTDVREQAEIARDHVRRLRP